jgi:hypothetical protein
VRARDTLANPDYSDTHEITRPVNSNPSAETWMRSVFEGPPRPLRWFVLAGWWAVLGFRPGPRRSTSRILGWPIISKAPDMVVLEQHSALMTAHLVLTTTDRRVTLAALVRFEHSVARAV